METNIKKRLLYARVSGDKKDKDNSFEQNPEIQCDSIYETFPESIGASVILERGSAWKKSGRAKRPEFDNMIRMIENGEIGSIYVYNLNRLARNMMRGMEFYMLCLKHDVQLYSVQQKMLSEMGSGIMAKAMQHVMVVLYNTFAEIDSTDKSEKIKSTVVREAGKPTVSYRQRQWGAPQQVNPQQIAAWRAMRVEGLSFKAISEKVGYSVGCVHENLSK